ncbi:15070_t:CDS:2, partial [Gigaspora margarita]
KALMTIKDTFANLIQQSGRAGHDHHDAQDVIFYTDRDIKTNYGIITENYPLYPETADQVYLSKKKDIFDMLFFCVTKYECQIKALIEYYAWSEDKEPNECAKCDNCNCRIKDNPIIRNVIPNIEELLHVVEVLTTTYDYQIIPANVIGVFRRLNTARMKKFGYQQLEEFYDQQDIKKSKKPKLLEFMSCILVIEGFVNGAKEIVKAQEWKYW